MTEFAPGDKLARAVQALAQGDFPTGISPLEEEAAEDSDNANAWGPLGVCYLETRRPPDRAGQLDKALGFP